MWDALAPREAKAPLTGARLQMDQEFDQLVKLGLPGALNAAVAFELDYEFTRATVAAAEAGTLSITEAVDQLIELSNIRTKEA